MPHVIVKLYPGRTEEAKKKLALQLEKDIIEILDSTSEATSVAIEEIPSDQWEEKVVKPDILEKKSTIYKMPGV